MTIPETDVPRKQQFNAALKYAGMTVEDWKRDVYPVSRIQLHRVLTGEQRGSPLLNKAIDSFIEDVFSRLASDVSRGASDVERQEPAA